MSDIFNRRPIETKSPQDVKSIRIISTNGTAKDTIVTSSNGDIIEGITKLEITIDAETELTTAVIHVLSPEIIVTSNDNKTVLSAVEREKAAQALLDKAAKYMEKNPLPAEATA